MTDSVNDMHIYEVHFRDPENNTRRMIKAHRVEGWTNDYAFFGHPSALGEVTVLLPRDTVEEVRLYIDAQREMDCTELVGGRGNEQPLDCPKCGCREWCHCITGCTECDCSLTDEEVRDTF